MNSVRFPEEIRNIFLIKLINENKLNINDLSYEKKMSVMKTAHAIALDRENEDLDSESESE